MTNFSRLAAAAKQLGGSRTKQTLAKNACVLPKAAWLSDLATRWSADHIHCHWGGTTATMAMAASSMCGIPWSLTLHRWDIVEDNLLAEKAESATLVRFISQDGLRMGRERGVPEGSHIRVIRMGVDMPPAVANGRPEGRIVLCPARLVPVKGHRYLLEAWRKVRDHGMAAELWLAGGGPLRDTLEKQAASLGIRNSVRFLGTIPHNRLLGMYEKFGIAATVLPSIDMGEGNHEGIPVALIEAMSYGVPVVATRTGGTGELVLGGTGLLVRAQDSDELATAILSLLKDPVGARRLGEFGRLHVASEYDIRQIAAELLHWFEAARSHGPAPVPALAAS
jgi:glycosyltransferase involved in cell wall biosynthesis